MSECVKIRTNVSINGRDYSILSSDSSEYIQKIAIELDKRIAELAGAYFNLSSADVATLAALNAMDESIKAREELEKVAGDIESLREALRNTQLKLHQHYQAEHERLQKENERLRAENSRLRGQSSYGFRRNG